MTGEAGPAAPSAVRSAAGNAQPALIQLTGTECTDSALAQTAHRDGLEAAGWDVRSWTWTPASTDQLATAVEQLAGRLVQEVPVVVVDVLVDDEVAATALVEAAWSTGATTLLRSGTPHGSGSTSFARAAALADVFITHPAAHDSQARALRGSPAHVTREWAVADTVDLVGPLAPVQTNLTLTVLVTTFGRPAELKACLSSLTRQTLARSQFDVVVVDDASPIDVTPIVASFSNTLRTTLVRLTDNGGLGRARGVGVEASEGDVVLLLDDDDIATPRLLAEHLRLHAEHPGEGVAVLGHTVVSPHGRLDVLSRHVTHVGGQYFSYTSWRSGAVLDWPAFWGGRSSAKRSLMKRVPFRGAFMEDTDFAWRAEQDLQERGAHLRVHYARQAVQMMLGSLGLGGIRRRQVRMGMAAWRFRSGAGEDLTEVLEAAHLAVANGCGHPAKVLSDLVDQASTPLTQLRATFPPVLVANRLLRLDALLSSDLAAHHGSGMLAEATAAHLASTGEVPVLGVDASHHALHEVVLASRPEDAVRIVVRTQPDPATVTEVVDGLVEALAAEGRTLKDVGDVEIRPVVGAICDMADVHFVLAAEGSHPAPEGPLHLMGLAPREWVAWLATRGGEGGALR